MHKFTLKTIRIQRTTQLQHEDKSSHGNSHYLHSNNNKQKKWRKPLFKSVNFFINSWIFD